MQPRVSGCTKKATCCHTTTKPVTFTTLPGLLNECHPAGRGSRVFVGCLGHNLGHGKSKFKELLLVQEGGLTLSHMALAPRLSRSHCKRCSIPHHEAEAF